MSEPTMANLVVAITGASGAVYAVRLLEVLLGAGRNVSLSISPAGKAVIEQELGRRVDLDVEQSTQVAEVLFGGGVPGIDRLSYYRHGDLFAPMASGSSLSDGMVICPCSGGTLSAIAHGMSSNLIQRAAAVHLKERRPLVLVPRETPLSSIQLENMKRCVDAGAVVLPAMPGFYHGAETVADLVDFIVARICDQLGVEHRLMRRWGEPPDA
ncbi:MAG: UbiX family flavin prenyltransferase [Planctomycetales bacterium]|nr:UbiX family flavin prenyltransferase [Planctomycetales bacterium]